MPDRRGLIALVRVAAAGVAAIGVALAAMSGCAGSLAVDPAPEATASACATLITELPASVAGQARRGTGETPGVAAWGDPAVVLRCGTAPPGPTTDPCVSAGDVDWVELARDESGAALFAAYGRVPGVEVEIPAGPAPGDVLVDLAAAVGALPQERACT